MNNTCSREDLDKILMLAEQEPEKLYHAFKEYWHTQQLPENSSSLSAAAVFEQATHIEETEGKQHSGKDADRMPGSYQKRISRYWVGIAAVLILTIGIAAYFFNDGDTTPATATITDVAAPGRSKATVRLADGQTISLDSLMSGTLAVQGDGKLIKNANGQLVYETDAATADHAPVYNTLDNPRGSKVIDMILADGTHVWLNAGSSITFPVAFTGNDRKVQLRGEAYLDVSHNAAKPFIVQTGDVTIRVLGTGFNVDAYQGADPVKVTLIKGSVKLSSKSANSLLKPGQQASVKEQIRISNNVDLDDVLAWKNNKFVFDNSSIQQIMRQLEQWYDVDVVYEGAPTGEAFMGSISRNVNLSQILSLLSETHAVHFEQKGKK
ncbi:FecR family protein [Niabella hibiscisoli]|uniref:FecR family protein n=1 Tax=Niabella hibiscisoli TaxID=1825928 RepID=UPI001F0EBBF1|nr:FecR family protein [Niabella hibiscisoli]MCH5720114.1 FecR domain-containing protein [Niabella hibiscisoli]